jgi:hypothetical protein
LIECAASWKNIEHNKFLCGEEHRDHSSFAPTACRVLGMTYAAERENIFEDAVVCWNQDSSPVTVLSESFISNSCKILHISFAPSRLFEHHSRHEGLNKACLTPWSFFGKSVVIVYLPKLCFMLIEIRIPARRRVHRDGRGPGTFWTSCISYFHIFLMLQKLMVNLRSPRANQHEETLIQTVSERFSRATDLNVVLVCCLVNDNSLSWRGVEGIGKRRLLVKGTSCSHALPAEEAVNLSRGHGLLSWKRPDR